MKRLLVTLLLAAATPSATAEMLDVDLSDETLHADFAGPLPSWRAEYHVGALFGKEDDRRVTQAHGALLVTGDAGARDANVIAGLGGRLAGVDAEDPTGGKATGGALALGGMIEARIPAFNRIGGHAYAYWAPEAASFGDLDGYLEYAIAADYQVLRNAAVMAGYRQLNLDIRNVGEINADLGFFLGLRLKF